MNSHEINELSDIIVSRVYEKIVTGDSFSKLFELAIIKNLDSIAELIAGKVINKLEESGCFDISNVDMDKLASVVNNLSTTTGEPQLSEEKIEL